MGAQAVILVGGLGTRLGNLTRSVPKSMVLIGEKPFLEWLIHLLTSNGINELIFCAGYKAEQIQEHFEDGKKFNCRIRYSIEKHLLGTGGAIKKAARLLVDPFILLNGDNFLSLDYQNLINCFHRLPRAVGMLTCWFNRDPVFQSNVRLNQDKTAVLDYNYKDATGKNYVDCGVKIFSRELLTYFDERDEFSLEADVMPALARKGLLYAYAVEQPPMDIGTPSHLEATRHALLKKGVFAPESR